MPPEPAAPLIASPPPPASKARGPTAYTVVRGTIVHCTLLEDEVRDKDGVVTKAAVLSPLVVAKAAENDQPADTIQLNAEEAAPLLASGQIAPL